MCAFVLHPNYQLVVVRLKVLEVEDQQERDWNGVPDDRTPVVEHLPFKRIRESCVRNVRDHTGNIGEHEGNIVVPKCLLAVLDWRIDRLQLAETNGQENHT